MSSFSFPFPTNGTDNQVTAEMAREFNAALFTNGILEDFVLASQANSVLQFTAGQCIIDGAFFSVGSGVEINLSARTEATLYIVVRMDVSSRASTMIATAALSDLDNLRDLVVGIATLTASGYTFSNANKSAYSTIRHLDGSTLIDGTITEKKLKDSSVTAAKLAGQIPMTKLVNKVFGSVASVSVANNSSSDLTVPLPAGWTGVLACVASPCTVNTRCLVLGDGVNRTVRTYFDSSSGGGTKAFEYILFGY